MIKFRHFPIILLFLFLISVTVNNVSAQLLSNSVDNVSMALCNPGPAGPITGTANVCQGQTYNYKIKAISPAPYQYIWVLPSGYYIVSGTNTDSIMVNFSSSAKNDVIYVYGECAENEGTYSPLFKVTVNSVPAQPTITAGGSTTFCAGGSVTLTSSAGSSYAWSTGATTQSITVTNTGSYTVKVTNSGGCQSIASAPAVVTVNALPSQPTITAGGSTTFCNGGSVTLTSSAGSSYAWSTGATTQSITVSATGNYTVKVTNSSGCQSIASAPAVVTVNALPSQPIITAGGSTTFCNGGSVTLTSSAGSFIFMVHRSKNTKYYCFCSW